MKSIISVDLGATNLRVGLIDDKLNILKVLRERTTREQPLLLYAQIKRLLAEVLNDIPSGVTPPATVGVSACGYVEDNFILNLPNLKIKSFDLKHHIESDFPSLSVYIANDANAAAFTESVYGASTEVKNSFFLTISSGIGGCLVYDHKLVDLPFEIGHVTITYQNRFYEAESLLSGNGLVKLAALNKLEIKDAGELFKLKKVNDPKALKVYDEWIKHLAMLIANIQILFSTDMIVLSGGVMKSATDFEEDLLAIAQALIAPIAVKPIVFAPAKFDQDAGLIGGAGLALRMEQINIK